MVEILLYAFGIMYTPGPVNLLSLHAGLNGQARAYPGFCFGVGCAMLLLFLLFGYAGAWIISPQWQQPLGLLGSAYIFYLAAKILIHTWQENADSKQLESAQSKARGFHHGFLMQLLNPKAPVAILPIVSIQFPTAQISGPEIALWSLILSVLAVGAPGSYLITGQLLGKKIRTQHLFRVLNCGMAGLLIYTGLIMLGDVLRA